MKRFLIVLVMLLLSTILLVGCNGDGVIPPLVEEPPIDLIREYTARDCVQRWPDGVVSVVDSIGGTKEIWEEINSIIDGPVIFQLTNDSTAQVGIEFQPVDGMFYVGFPGLADNEFKRCGILINPATTSEYLEAIFMNTILIAVGINNNKKWDEGFSENMRIVLYWLYRLEPGYSLL